MPGDEGAHSWHGVLCDPMAGGLSDEARGLVKGLWVVPKRLLRSPMVDGPFTILAHRAHIVPLCRCGPLPACEAESVVQVRRPGLYGNLGVTRR